MKPTFSLILLISLLSFRDLHASDCPVLKNGPVEAAYSEQEGRNLNCDYVKDVESILSSITSFSEDKVSVNLFVQLSFDNASFDSGTIIEIPEQLIFQGQYNQEYPVSLTSNLSTVAHEYGHALLEKKLEHELENHYPEAKYIKVSQEISKLKIAANLNPESKEIKNQLARKNADLIKDKNNVRFINLTLGYSELYADVVAAYFAENKNNILNALYYNELSDQQYKMLQLRSFDTEFDSSHAMAMTEAHGYFAYTRNFIGKNLWPKTLAEKKSMLKIIGDAITAEVKNLLDKKLELPEYQEANELLIKRLQKSIK